MMNGITFGELVEHVYNQVEAGMPDAPSEDVARVISDWTANGRVRFDDQQAVRRAVKEFFKAAP